MRDATSKRGARLSMGAVIFLTGLSSEAAIAETATVSAPADRSPHERTWQAGVTLQNSFGGEYLETYRRNLVIDAAKAKLEVRVVPVAGLRFGLAVLGKDYRGTTTIP